MADQVQIQIGPYQVIREIGRGGMGVVVLAHDSRLDRHVAIKSLPEDVLEDQARLERFEREAKSIAQLNHPNIAGIYGVEEQDGRRYLVLEYVEGPTLGERLEPGPLGFEEAIEIAIQIAGGIEAAHEAGVIHRDLKPENVKISESGVKVLDFGLAKAEGATSTMSTAPTVTGKNPTLPGVIIGTAAYMSPEQARGRKVDKRTDIWSFGVLLYEMLTGASPFAGESAQDSIGAVLHKEVDLDRLPRQTPQMVRRVLKRCLERDKARRYQNLGDVRLDLEEAVASDSDGADAAPAHRSPATWGGWVIGLVGIVALILAVAWKGPAGGAPADLVRTSIMAPPGLTFQDFAMSPDGSMISMICEPMLTGPEVGTRMTRLYVRDVSWPSMRAVPGSEGTFVHQFSPDGSLIAFIARGRESSDPERLFVVPADLSSPAVELLRVPDEFKWGAGWWFCFSPRGNIVLIDRNKLEIAVFDGATGRELRRMALTSSLNAPDMGGLCGPFGDQHVCATVMQYTDEGFRFDAMLINVDTGEAVVAIENASKLTQVGDGQVIVNRSDALYLADFDDDTMRVVGRMRPVESGLATEGSWRHANYSMSRHGALTYIPGGLQGTAREIVMIDRDGRSSVWSEEKRAFEESIEISNDGSRLCVLIAGPGGLFELWVSEVEVPRLRRLLAAPGTDYYNPLFTPDGEHLIVASWNPQRDEAGQILVVRFDGTEPPRRIHGGWGLSAWPMPRSVSADGERVLMHHYLGGADLVYEVPLDGDGPTITIMEPQEYFSISYAPTAPLIGYVTTDAGRAEAYVREVTDDGLGPAVPVTTRGAWACEWIVDPDEGLCLTHFDLEWKEWKTPISLADGRVTIGQTVPTGRLGDVRFEDRAYTLDGRCVVIRKGEDEQPPTRLDLVQGWWQSVK